MFLISSKQSNLKLASNKITLIFFSFLQYRKIYEVTICLLPAEFDGLKFAIHATN